MLGFLRYMKDQALPPQLQDGFMKKSGIERKIKDIEADYAPFFGDIREGYRDIGRAGGGMEELSFKAIAHVAVGDQWYQNGFHINFGQAI